MPLEEKITSLLPPLFLYLLTPIHHLHLPRQTPEFYPSSPFLPSQRYAPTPSPLDSAIVRAIHDGVKSAPSVVDDIVQEARAGWIVAGAALAGVVCAMGVGGGVAAPVFGLAQWDDAPRINRVADALLRIRNVADEFFGVGGEGAVEPCIGDGVVRGADEDGPFVCGHGGGDEVGFEGEIETGCFFGEGEDFRAGEGAGGGGEGGEGGDVVHYDGEASIEHFPHSGVEGAEFGGEFAELDELVGGVIGGFEDGLGDGGGLLEGGHEDGAE